MTCTCQFSQLYPGSAESIHLTFWVYEGLHNTICSVIDMLIFLFHVSFLCQTEVREARVKRAHPLSQSLHREAGVVRVEGQLRTRCEKADLCFQSCCIQTPSRDLVFLDVPVRPDWSAVWKPTRGMQFEVLPLESPPKKGKSLTSEVCINWVWLVLWRNKVVILN